MPVFLFRSASFENCGREKYHRVKGDSGQEILLERAKADTEGAARRQVRLRLTAIEMSR